MKFFIIFTLFMYSAHADNQFVSDKLMPLTDEMVTALNAINITWKAGNNFNGNISVDKLVSTVYENYFNSEFRLIYYSNYSYPESFDARQVWPNCTSIGKVYDQTKGFPSWIYAAVGSIADRLCISKGIQIDVESTVEQLVRSNGNFNGPNSANLYQAFEYWVNNGIHIVESEKQKQCLPLGNECKTVKNHLDQYYQVSADRLYSCDDEMQEIMKRGPLASFMEVYSDFLNYNSGVYQPASKEPLGMHAVKLIGWGTENGVKYWLAINSWGQNWGENGVFKMKKCMKHGRSRSSGVTPQCVKTSFTQSTSTKFSDAQMFTLA